MRNIINRITLLLVPLLATTVSCVAAQEVGTEAPSQSAICERAARSLKSRPPAQGYSRAIADLPACGVVGARALEDQWKEPPSDTATVRVLGEVTPRLRDRQVFDAVVGAFRDPARRRDLRLAALEALMGYYEPGVGAAYVEPALAVQHGSAYVMMGQGDPVATYRGAAPLSASTRTEILQVLEMVSKQDTDERVRLISAYIHSRLSALR